MERLWEKVDRSGGLDACWPWTAGKMLGYGLIGLGGRAGGNDLAHRVIAKAALGPPPPRHEARHLCGNRACCNPLHLAWGTRSQNEADKLAHGRSNRGERHGLAKLTEADVHELRRLAWSGVRHSEIALRFGVSTACIRDVLVGRRWAWLTTDREGVMPS
jgi:hypothetical protein